MNVLASLLLLVTLAHPVTTLVLRTGEKIEVEGSVREENGRVIFRAAGGTLYSIPFDEVDLEATLASSRATETKKTSETKKLKLTAEERRRLIEELQRNHAGVPAPEQAILTTPPPPKSKAEERQEQQDEWTWRRQARSHEEAIRRSQENLELLRARAEQLRGEIAGLLSLGFKPKDFTYQTTQLQHIVEQIPWAELDVQRAQRAYTEFREDARKQGITPGWLR